MLVERTVKSENFSELLASERTSAGARWRNYKLAESYHTYHTDTNKTLSF
jgi:hypothetical protein